MRRPRELVADVVDAAHSRVVGWQGRALEVRADRIRRGDLIVEVAGKPTFRGRWPEVSGDPRWVGGQVQVPLSTGRVLKLVPGEIVLAAVTPRAGRDRKGARS